MPQARGKLTEAQAEILEVFWAAEPDGATVTDVWNRLQESREVARNTVLTMIRRLEKRGWLKPVRGREPPAYRPACKREDANSRLAGELLDSYFGGSPADLMMSLLGSRKVTRADIERIREMLDEAEGKS